MLWVRTSITFSTAICHTILSAYIQGVIVSTTVTYLHHPQRFTHPTTVQSRLPDASKEVLAFEAISEVSGAIEDAS